jgi:hypothetical protein
MMTPNFFRYRSFFVCGAIFLIGIQVVVVGVGISGGLAGRADFRMLYSGGYSIRTGHGDQIYDDTRIAATETELAGQRGANLPFNHPAYEGLLFALLSILSYKKAYWSFFFLNVVLLLVAIRLLRPAPEWMNGVRAGLPVTAVAGFVPVGICLIQGQDSIVFFFLVAAGYALQKGGRDFAAGLVLGLGMFRFQLMIPLVVLLCFARKWKLLAGFVVTCVAVSAISVAITEPAPWMTYPRYLAAMNSGLQTESQRLAHGIHPTEMPNLRGLVQLLFGARVPGATLQVLTVSLSGLLMAWAVLKRLPFELLVVIAVLVSYHGLIHDSVLLLLPLLTCGIASSQGKQLLAWGTLVASPMLAFVLHLPLALLSLVYLVFFVVLEAVT